MNTLPQQRILVVDDEKKIRELLSEYLTKENYEVITAKDGVEVDKCLLNNHIDLVILDLMLPGEDGLSIGRRLYQKNNLLLSFLLVAMKLTKL